MIIDKTFACSDLHQELIISQNIGGQLQVFMMMMSFFRIKVVKVKMIFPIGEPIVRLSNFVNHCSWQMLGLYREKREIQ